MVIYCDYFDYSMENIFQDLGLVIITASVLGVLGYFFKQPLILMFIAAGVILGPSVSGLIHDIHFIEEISHFGVMLMLFLIGLEMSTSRLKDLGFIALAVGFGQVVFTAIAGYFSAIAFGFSGLPAIYIALALTFSSTVIAVKLLSEKRDIHSFYGQITIGILIVQDILAIIALLTLSGISTGSSSIDIAKFAPLLLGGAFLALVSMVFAKHVLSLLYAKIASSQELLILFSLAWCFIIAITAQSIGLSIEMGAFIAGLNLANLPYTYEINAKAKLLRDFFITIFFVALGAGMKFTGIETMMLPIILFSLFIIIGNPIIVMTIMGLFGYDKRNSFFTGIAIANVSEFSLILLTQGVTKGHIPESLVSMLTIITIITMVSSSYLITYNAKCYAYIKKYLDIFEKKKTAKTKATEGMRNHIILLGYDDTGKQILKQIQSFKDDYIVVDHDNNAIKSLIEQDVPCVFGDVEDEDLLDELSLEDTEMIISTLPNTEDNHFMFKKIAELPANKRPIVIAVADTGRNGFELFNKGADYVIVKSYLGATQMGAINKVIYNLPDITQIAPHNIAIDPTKNKFAKDIDYSSFLENLNAIRLHELKDRFAKKSK